MNVTTKQTTTGCKTKRPKIRCPVQAASQRDMIGRFVGPGCRKILQEWCATVASQRRYGPPESVIASDG